MKRFLRYAIGVWVFILMGGPLSAQAEVEPPALSAKMDKLIRSSRVKSDEMGVVVQWHHAGKSTTLYSLNEEKPFILASVTKLLTGGATLDILGPGFKFVTEIKSAAPIKKGVLKGDLYLVGGGDPGFVSETMWFLVNEFVRSGIKTIEGNILVDESRFDQVRTDPSRQNGRVDRAYDAPVGAMSFNWNSVNIYVRPGIQAGASASVFLDPENEYTVLDNRVTTKGSDGRHALSADRIVDDKIPGDRVRVSGRIATNKSEVVIYKNITHPALWSGYALKSFLSQRGIKVTGHVRVKVAPLESRVIAKAESKPVSSLVTDMMKWSNNYVAEMLVKNLAAEKVSRPARLEDGNRLIKEKVVKWGIPQDQFELVNPSGLTRENRFRPLDFVKILEHIEKRFDFFPETLVSLPISGTDGTLKNRLTQSRAKGRVRAKTGSLNGVTTMAGYAGRDDGSTVTFVFLFNGRADRGEDARVLIDQMTQVLLE